MRIDGDHIEFDPGAGRRQLVDANRRAGRRPGAKILRQHRHHAVHVAHVGQILRYLDDVGPGQALMIEDGLDVVHGQPRLLGDAHGMLVLVQFVRVLVIERRGVAPEMNNRSPGASTRIAGA